MPQTNNPTWTLFDAGRERDLRSGYLQNAATNERFYRGDQWKTPRRESGRFRRSADPGLQRHKTRRRLPRLADFLVKRGNTLLGRQHRPPRARTAREGLRRYKAPQPQRLDTLGKMPDGPARETGASRRGALGGRRVLHLLGPGRADPGRL